MLDLIKELKKNMVLVSIFYLLVGIILVAFPQTSGTFICYVIGALAIFYGVVHGIIYFTQKVEYVTYQYHLVKGIIGIVIGVYVLMVPEVLIATLPTAMGLIVLVDSVIKIQNAVDLKRMRYNRWWLVLLGALITLLFGFLMIFYPFTAYFSIIIFVGASLIVNGVCDLVTIFILQKKIKEFKKEVENVIIDQNPIEEEIL